MLELKNISYEVDDDNDNKEILKNVNLTIDEHFVAITGPNGGGKSTLAPHHCRHSYTDQRSDPV